METLGKRLRRLRRDKGLSISDLAKMVGVSESTYREWEYGRAIRGEPYGKLADTLDVSVSELLFGEKHGNQSVESLLLQIEHAVQKIRRCL